METSLTNLHSAAHACSWRSLSALRPTGPTKNVMLAPLTCERDICVTQDEAWEDEALQGTRTGVGTNKFPWA